MKRTILKWLAVIIPVLCVVGYLAVGAIAANSLSVPERHFSIPSDSAFSVAHQDVRFPARGGDAQIAGWFIPNTTGQRVIILVHGKNQSRADEWHGRFHEMGTALYQNGYSVLMIDLRGHGQSTDARFSFGLNERRDVQGAVDWLEQKGFKPGSIGVLGVSMGAASAIGAAAEDGRIGAVVEDSSFASFCPILQSEWASASGLPDFFLPSALFMMQAMYGYDLCDARPVDEIRKIAPRPVLIIHSTSDMLVPVSEAQQLEAAAPFAETMIFTGSDHACIYIDNPSLYTQRVIEFFNKSLK